MMSRSRSIFRCGVFLAAVLLVALTLAAATPQAITSAAVVQASAAFAPDAPPSPVITYQGRLVNPATGEPKPDGTYYATFELWNSEVGGTSLWSEDQRIVTNKGLFSVTLGTLNAIDPAFFDGYGRWLSVSIQPDGALAPRIRIAHVPYAIWSNVAANAVNADRLGGQLPSAYAAASHTHDASAITTGALAYDRFNAYGDLANDGRIGAAAGMVAAGLHTHTGADIVDGSISTADLADGSVTSAKIADGAVALADLAANSVDSAKIVDLAVATADLANSSVTSAKIADGGVANADLADSSVTTAKISSSGASTNHVLQYTGSAVAWGYAPGSEIRYTVLNVNCASVASFTTTYVKVADIGSVNKLDASSRLEITFNGRIYAGSVTSTGAVFELRVDNTATTNGRARANLKAAEVGGAGVPVSIMGIFTGFGAGTHTVSIWVAASYGSGTNAYVDPGCWSTDHIVVREIK